MTGFISTYAVPGVVSALSVLAIRAFPIVVHFCASASRAPLQACISASLYAAVAFFAALVSDFDASVLVRAYAYLGSAAGVLYVAAGYTRSRLGLMALSLSLFLIAPGLLLMRSGHDRVVLTLGWELALSAYSYCIEVGRRSFSQYAFFVFVNPALVYAQRGTEIAPPGIARSGVARVLRGVAAFMVSGAIGVAGRTLLASSPLPLLSHGAVRLAETYLAHTGLASIQIGLFRQLGYVAPERYLRPFSATGPREFWSRWNTYVGSWVRIYVFNELARRTRKWHGAATTSRARNARSAAFVLLSFAFTGILHDVYTSLVRSELVWFTTAWFAVAALLFVAWEAIVAAARLERFGAYYKAAGRVLVLGCAVVLAGVLP